MTAFLLMQSPGRAGALHSSKELQKFALEAVPSYVTRLTAATLEPFMASDPLRPKARLSSRAMWHVSSCYARDRMQLHPGSANKS